jgi:prepilin-type N-terminal cleavage/methylation domain-containing protein
MRRKGFTLVEIMIVVAIIALLAAIAIPNLLRAKMSANEAAAQATLRTISTACETFAGDNDGTYPGDEDADLVNVNPPYLSRGYRGATVQGYLYTYTTFDQNGYQIDATPQNPGTAGNHNYRITTGGVLTTTDAGAS